MEARGHEMEGDTREQEVWAGGIPGMDNTE